MKCEKCGNEYPSRYYFETETICKDCFAKITDEEKNQIINYQNQIQKNPIELRQGFGLRFAAILIDFAILWLITTAIMQFSDFNELINQFNEILKEAQTDPDMLNEAMDFFFENIMFYYLFSTLFTLCYYLTEVLLAASPGKLILRLRIGTADAEHSDYGKLIIRFLIKHSFYLVLILSLLTKNTLLYLLTFIVFIVVAIGFLFVFSYKRQALHDLISGTAVYKLKDLKENN